MKILVVEDEKSLLNIITKRLKEEGYSVDSCLDGEEGLYCSDVFEYDICILDIMLPKIDGLTILRNLRAKKKLTPVLILTAMDSISDRVDGLDSGADDYLTKPFSFDELFARLRALLRRESSTKDNMLKVSDLKMDTLTRMVTRNGINIELTSKEYAILEYFLRNTNMTLTRSQIVEHIWNYDFDSGTNIVDVYIRYLRTKIDDDFDKKLIHTVRGVGYVLRCDQ